MVPVKLKYFECYAVLRVAGTVHKVLVREWSVIPNVSVLCPWRKHFWCVQKGCCGVWTHWTPSGLFSEGVPWSRWGFWRHWSAVQPLRWLSHPTPQFFKTLWENPFRCTRELSCRLECGGPLAPGPGSRAWPRGTSPPNRLFCLVFRSTGFCGFSVLRTPSSRKGRHTKGEAAPWGPRQQRTAGTHPVCRSSAPVLSFQ